jgi:hypothetical protein
MGKITRGSSGRFLKTHRLVRAHALQPGDVLGTGETVIRVFQDKLSGRGKLSVVLKMGETERCTDWGRWRRIIVQDPELELPQQGSECDRGADDRGSDPAFAALPDVGDRRDHC